MNKQTPFLERDLYFFISYAKAKKIFFIEIFHFYIQFYDIKLKNKKYSFCKQNPYFILLERIFLKIFLLIHLEKVASSKNIQI